VVRKGESNERVVRGVSKGVIKEGREKDGEKKGNTAEALISVNKRHQLY
jgi:hypothetical protein